MIRNIGYYGKYYKEFPYARRDDPSELNPHPYKPRVSLRTQGWSAFWQIRNVYFLTFLYIRKNEAIKIEVTK